MKRIHAAGLFLLLAAFLFGLSVGKTTSSSSTQLPKTSSSPAPTPRDAIVPTPQPGYYKVARVLDGDTIEISSGERVRYHGIDAPENNEKWGTVAYKTNRDLVEGKTVRIEIDRPTRDQYGRILAYVWVGNTMVNERLVDDGLAKILIIKGEVKLKYLSILQAAEARARGATRGLWTPQP
ncbi:MAG: thermonuclease family protein [Candidatus Gottesmanbacteria bacterium]|nr:thermonuclease family protein [Candidatus Gottesmanbacteria bacterium]